MVEYHIPVSAGGVANIFQLLEMNKAVFEIKHFSVSQTTLEEVSKKLVSFIVDTIELNCKKHRDNESLFLV